MEAWLYSHTTWVKEGRNIHLFYKQAIVAHFTLLGSCFREFTGSAQLPRTKTHPLNPLQLFSRKNRCKLTDLQGVGCSLLTAITCSSFLPNSTQVMAAEHLPTPAPVGFKPGILGLKQWETSPKPGLYPCDSCFAVCSNTALICFNWTQFNKVERKFKFSSWCKGH